MTHQDALEKIRVLLTTPYEGCNLTADIVAIISEATAPVDHRTRRVDREFVERKPLPPPPFADHWERLRMLDDHLALLIDLAKLRTSGLWKRDNTSPDMVWNEGASHEYPKLVARGLTPADVDFVAAAAGNAEAGWKSVRAAIAGVMRAEARNIGEFGEPGDIGVSEENRKTVVAILAEWPLDEAERQ